jgi:uncharacterized phage protein (TIGR02220 family)
MAKFRNVHTTFWQDDFVLELTPEEKYFYVYLMTNSKTTQCGIYNIPTRLIEMESGYNRETVVKLLKRFVEYGKILYNEPTKEVFMVNWMKYNYINSPKVLKCIEKELKEVKHKPFIKEFHTQWETFGYPTDTVSIGYGEEEEEEKEKEEEKNNIVVDVIDYLNKQADKNYKASTKRTKSLVNARIQEGFGMDDFKRVIDNKVKAWKSNEQMNVYLRPETLFSTKFEGYLNEQGVVINYGTHDKQNGGNEFETDAERYKGIF